MPAFKILAIILVLVTGLHPAHGDEIIPIPAAEKPAVKKSPKDNQKEDQDTPIQSSLNLINGDEISGLPLSINEQMQLLFDSKHLHQTAHFPVSNIVSLLLGQHKPSPQPATLTRVQLHPRFHENNGDTIIGELRELTPDSVKLHTSFGGIIEMKRSMVKSLKVISTIDGNYHGPNSIDEWTMQDSATPGAGRSPQLPGQLTNHNWHFSDNALISKAEGSIGKDVGLRERSHVSFDVTWEKYMRFKIQLYSNNISNPLDAAYYEVNVNRSYIYLNTRGKSKGVLRNVGGGKWRQIPNVPTGKKAHLDIFTDRKAGIITIYINGSRSCTLQSENPDPENLGKGIVFISQDQYPISISNIIVTPWNGKTFPDAKAVSPQSIANAGDQPPHKIILINGDEVPGTVGIVENDRMIVETKHTTIRIPIDKIQSLSLGNSIEEPKKYRDDVRAWFHSGGFVTLKLRSLGPDKLIGFNQALGDVGLDLKAFRRIDFQLYDEEVNAMRKKTSL